MLSILFNPLPDMPILGFSNSAANKDMSPKYGQMGLQLSDWVENIVGKGKLLVTSNLSFSHNVFKSCLYLICQNEYLWSKRLNVRQLRHNSESALTCLIVGEKKDLKTLKFETKWIHAV